MGDLKRIGREVRALASGKGRRYPAKLRRRIVRAVDRARESSMTWASIVEEVGVPLETLRRWQADAGNEVELKPVVLAEAVAVARHNVVVVTPGGYRVEGLDIGGAATLLRKLSS